MSEAAATVVAIIVAVAMFTTVIGLCGLGFQFAWNMAIPALFGLPRCGLSEGLGLALLANIFSLSFRLTVGK